MRARAAWAATWRAKRDFALGSVIKNPKVGASGSAAGTACAFMLS